MKKLIKNISKTIYFLLVTIILFAGLGYAIVSPAWDSGVEELDNFEVLRASHIDDLVEHISAVYNLFQLNFINEEGNFAAAGGEVRLHTGYVFYADEIEAGILSSLNFETSEIWTDNIIVYDNITFGGQVPDMVEINIRGMEIGTDISAFTSVFAGSVSVSSAECQDMCHNAVDCNGAVVSPDGIIISSNTEEENADTNVAGTAGTSLTAGVLSMDNQPGESGEGEDGETLGVVVLTTDSLTMTKDETNIATMIMESVSFTNEDAKLTTYGLAETKFDPPPPEEGGSVATATLDIDKIEFADSEAETSSTLKIDSLTIVEGENIGQLGYNELYFVTNNGHNSHHAVDGVTIDSNDGHIAVYNAGGATINDGTNIGYYGAAQATIAEKEVLVRNFAQPETSTASSGESFNHIGGGDKNFLYSFSMGLKDNNKVVISIPGSTTPCSCSGTEWDCSCTTSSSSTPIVTMNYNLQSGRFKTPTES